MKTIRSFEEFVNESMYSTGRKEYKIEPLSNSPYRLMVHDGRKLPAGEFWSAHVYKSKSEMDADIKRLKGEGYKEIN
jgi:hypothetical protein